MEEYRDKMRFDEKPAVGSLKEVPFSNPAKFAGKTVLVGKRTHVLDNTVGISNVKAAAWKRNGPTIADDVPEAFRKRPFRNRLVQV